MQSIYASLFHTKEKKSWNIFHERDLVRKAHDETATRISFQQTQRIKKSTVHKNGLKAHKQYS